MKTEQEQIEKIMCMFNKLKRGDYCVDNCYGCCGDEKIDITCHDVVVNFIQALMQAGYGDISEYKAEREMLGSQIKVLKQRLNDKYIEIDNLNRDYSNAFERLKSQQQEIERLKAENVRLTTKLGQVLLSIDTVKEMNAMCNIEEQVKQAKIDVLNRLKSLSIYDDNYLDGYVFIDDIDKLLEEYENDATRND